MIESSNILSSLTYWLYCRIMKSTSIYGDIRLDKVQDRLISAMVTRQSVIIRQLSDDRNGEMCYHRFLENEKVIPQKIVESFNHSSSTDYSGKHLFLSLTVWSRN